MKHNNRRRGEIRSHIDMRQNIDHRYEDPEFHHLIDRRTNEERRNGDRRKGEIKSDG